MSDNPYFITGPALIIFSGGRTSAYMLYQILQAHGGTLPDDVVVAFANTGKEREETLRFVHECETQWGVKVHWLEWRDTEAGFEEVGYNSAARAGEPFAALIEKRGFVPNGVTRFCTTVLKIRTMAKFARSLGWERWNNPVGLRYDEGRRVLKQIARNESGLERFTALMPLSKARVTREMVEEWWSEQPFDLQLMPYEGNCDLCFLKSRGKLAQLMRDNPGMASWWIEQEAKFAGQLEPVYQSTGSREDDDYERHLVGYRPKATARFLKDESYADLQRAVTAQPRLPFDASDDEHDAECGLWCSPESEAA